jgi:hypothetical protein
LTDSHRIRPDFLGERIHVLRFVSTGWPVGVIVSGSRSFHAA